VHLDDEHPESSEAAYTAAVRPAGPAEAGDEILLIDGDFPATVYPWLPLRERGVRVRLFRLAAP